MTLQILVRPFPACYGNEQTFSDAIDRASPHNLVEKKSTKPNHKTDRVAQWNQQQLSLYLSISQAPHRRRPHQAETENQIGQTVSDGEATPSRKASHGNGDERPWQSVRE